MKGADSQERATLVPMYESQFTGLGTQQVHYEPFHYLGEGFV